MLRALLFGVYVRVAKVLRNCHILGARTEATPPPPPPVAAEATKAAPAPGAAGGGLGSDFGVPKRA